MKNKVIDLFSKGKIIQNPGVKYSELLEQFMAPFSSEFSNVEYYEDILDIAINAWNFGNMSLLVPKNEFKEIMSTAKSDEIDFDLLQKMIDSKVANFREFSNFIVDYEIKETKGGPILTVLTQEEDTYLTSLMEGLDNEMTEDEYAITEEDFDENYINRSAIILKPLQPFIDWCTKYYPDEIEEIKEVKIYLISDEIDDEQAWLKKKYDKIFKLVLEGWHSNKKKWPQKRNYKMFTEWFHVDISIGVYDLVKEPVSKNL